MFDSIGAGTFICFAALDITRTEFDTPEDRRQKWACATAGFAAMAVLAIWLLPPHGPPGPGQDALGTVPAPPRVSCAGHG